MSKEGVGPPADVDPTDLVIKLSEPVVSEVINFPRNDANGKPIGMLRIKVLQMEEHNIARMKANAALKKLGGLFGAKELSAADMQSAAVAEVLGDLVACELLALACLHEKSAVNEDEDGDKPFYPFVFREAIEVRKKLSADEVAVLFNKYQEIQYKFGPFEKTILDKDDEDAWITRLESGLDPLVLSRMPSLQLAEVTMSLARRLFSISRTVASQLESLPPSLASSLADCCMDTRYFGPQPEGSDSDGLEKSANENGPLPLDREMTDEESERADRILRGEEEPPKS